MLWWFRTLGGIVLILALCIGARRLFERPAPIPAPGPGERDTLVDGVRWRSREIAGKGDETVVYVHGLLSSSASWEKVLKAASGGRSAIAVDLPGFGYSDRPWPYDYSVPSQALHLLRFMTVRGIPRAILVGNSLGGAVTLLAAVAAPDRVAAIVLVDAASPVSEIPWTIQALRTPIVGEIEMELYIKPILDLSLQHRLYANSRNVTEAVVEREWRPVTVPGTRRAALAAVRSQVAVYEHMLERVHLPTLVVWGEQDRLLPEINGRRLAAAIPGSVLAILPGAGHMPQDETPEEFSQAVTGFLNGLAGYGSSSAPSSHPPPQ